MESDAASTTGQPPRKRMRKGTKSCAECRRRKLKCIHGDGPTCENCATRNLKCIDQEHADLTPKRKQNGPQHSLELRVNELEGRLQAVLDRSTLIKNPKQELRDLSYSLPESSGDLNKEDGEGTLGPPFLSLSLGRQDLKPSNQPRPGQVERDFRMSEAFRALLPNVDTIREIMSASAMAWTCWQRLLPEFLVSKTSSIPELIETTITSRTPTLLELARVMVLLGVALVQIPKSQSMRLQRLGGSAEEMSREYVMMVERFVTADDEMANSVEAVEIIMMQSMFYTDIGKPRKAWLVIGRAIKFAQLLNLHKPGVYRYEDPVWRRRWSLWTSLCLSDRNLSMLLGLPASTLDYSFAPSLALPQSPVINVNQQQLLKLMDITSQIIRRDQDPTNLSLPDTLRIDQEIEEIIVDRSVDELVAAQQPTETHAEYFERSIVCFVHHHVRTILHLPFMLKSRSDQRFSYNRTIAIQCSRYLLTCYLNIRRNEVTAGYTCKTIDFQAFISAMAVLINLLETRDDEPGQKEHEAQEHDSYLINETIEVLRNAGNEIGGAVGLQASKTLETIIKVYNSGGEDTLPGNGVICIPYFGTVTLRQRHNDNSRAIRQQQIADSSLGSNRTSHYSNTPKLTTMSSQYTHGPPTPCSSAQGYEGCEGMPALFPTNTVKSGTGIPDIANERPSTQAHWESHRFDHLDFQPLAGEMPSIANIGDVDFSQLGFDLDQEWNWR